MNVIITVNELTQAIVNAIREEGMTMFEEQAYEQAIHVLNFFGYSDRIIDNILEPQDRDTFYMLEDKGILTTEREETTLYDGREWRIHYWLFRKNRIEELIQAEDSVDDGDELEENIYDRLSDEVWVRASDEDEEEE